MKRPSPALYLRQRRLGTWSLRRRRRLLRRCHGPWQRRYVRPGAVIRAPSRFDITRGSGSAVTHFIAAVADRVLRQQQPATLDFRFAEAFYPAGTVLLFAELDRVISSSAMPKPLTILPPRLRKPREVLKQIGIFALTGDICDVVPSFHDVVYWRAWKGRTASGDEMSPLEQVIAHVNESDLQRLRLPQLWRGVSEAVSNSVEHAYLAPRLDGFAGLPDTRWWMFTQLRDDTFTVAVCDLGCGYRATIERTIPPSFIARMMGLLAGTNPDSRAIQTAMEYGRSGTSVAHRGKGSRDALSVLSKHGSGELLVASNTGWVRYQSDRTGEVAVADGSLHADIRATIIWWKLFLSGQTGD